MHHNEQEPGPSGFCRDGRAAMLLCDGGGVRPQDDDSVTSDAPGGATLPRSPPPKTKRRGL